MVCKNCGKYYVEKEASCIFCGALLEEEAGNDQSMGEASDYIGFARPGADYEHAVVVTEVNKQYDGENPQSKLKEIFQSDYLPVPGYEASIASNNRNILQSPENYDAAKAVAFETEGKVDPQKQGQEDHQKLGMEELQSQGSNNTKKQQVGSLINNKSLLLFASILLITVIGVFVFILLGKEKSISAYIGADALEVLEDEENATTYVFNTKGEKLHTLKGNILPVWYNGSYSTILFKHKLDETLTYIDANNYFELATPSKQQPVVANAQNGKMIYGENSEFGTRKLMLFDPKKGENKVIDETEELIYASVAISPDGKTYAYTKGTALSMSGKFESYLCVNGGKPKALGENALVLAVSDDSRYVYYAQINEDQTFGFYVKSKEGITFLSNTITSIILNNDLSEILCTNESKTILSVGGKAPVNVMDSQIIGMVVPTRSIITVINGGYIFNIDTFKNKVVICKDQMLRFIDFYYESKLLSTVSHVLKYQISKDMNELIFENITGELIRISNLAGSMDKQSIGTEVEEFMGTPDLSEIYYTKFDRTISTESIRNDMSIVLTSSIYDLYYQDKEGNSKILDTHVVDLQLNAIGDIAFYLKSDDDGNNSLYYSSHGEIGKKVEGFDKIKSLEAGNYGIIMKVNTDAVNRYDLYYNTAGTGFKLLLEDVFIMPEKENN